MALSKPTGKLAFAYQSIAILEAARKQDDALIRQLVEALENHQGNYKLTDAQCVPVNAAVTAARARMSPPPTA